MKLAYDAACNYAKPMCSASSSEIALETNAFIRSVCQNAFENSASGSIIKHPLVFLRDVANEQNFSRFCPKARHSAARVVFSIYCWDECKMSREETKKSHSGNRGSHCLMTRIDITMQFDSITMKYAGGAITRNSLLRISARENLGHVAIDLHSFCEKNDAAAFDSLIVRATIYLYQQGGLGNSKLPVVGIQLSLKRISELSRPGRRGDQEECLLQEMETEAVDRVHMYSIKVPTCLRPSNWGV
ncbi:hypothetical protein ALC56_11921 [Trachymyrmex septentrionalis]|uniref:Uncharacterized protein n=1 Tax=Trachymyrmex septentrionalis TaxID=34720 RepID=A0A195F0M3_9HYME|nr:hypothetical protein ALC56_11921 [Trachymyrmex septentrionalis]